MEDLFANSQEYQAFCNLKAKGRILSLEKDKSKFQDEISDILKKSDEILKQYGASINYISELINIDAQLQNIDIDKSDISANELTLKRDNLYNEYNQFLDNLPLSVREDLEFYYKKIFDRKLRLDESSEVISELDYEYPDARDLDVEDAFNTQQILKDIKNYLYPEDDFVSLEHDDDIMTLPYVTKISEAPESLLMDTNDTIEEIHENEPAEEVVTDNSFFDPSDDFTSKIEESDKIAPLFSEDKEEPVKLETIEVQLDEPTDISTLFANEEKQKEDEELTYLMEKGISLKDLALAVCDDENGWKDIYNANKDIILQRLSEKGLSDSDYAFENDANIFDGLALIIPNRYETNA